MMKKYWSWEEAMALAEIKALIQLNHPSIVKMKEVIWNQDTVYMIFEICETDLGKVIWARWKQNSHFTEE